MSLARYLLFFLFLALFGLVSPAFSEGEYAPLVLGQGEQRLIQIPGLSRFSLGSAAARALPLPKNFGSNRDSLLVKGVTPGLSDLWVWKEDGSSEHRTIRVERVSAEEFKASLEKALGQLEQTEILYAGSKVVLRGEITAFRESVKIHALKIGFPKELIDETELSEDLLIQGHESLSSWLKTSRYSGRLTLERVEKNLWVRGSISNANEKETVSKQIEAIFPAAYIDIDALPDNSPTVHFKVYLLELKKSRFSTIGLSWPAALEGAFHVTTSGIQDMISLDVALQTLEGDGSAKILSNPELVVRAPGEAELFSGGELPIHMESHFFSNVTWKTFGLTLKLKVSDTTADRVRLEIFTENSRLDPSLSTDDKIPGLQANRMKTQVDALYGAPLFLSGLMQHVTRQQAKGLPLLRQIPILGLLFGSEDYLNENSELVAILLPNRNPPMAPMEKFSGLIPKGQVPVPRNWISQSELKTLKDSSEYPWNALH